MNLRPKETVTKAMISSPCSFIGEFDMDGLVVAQAWESLGDPSAHFKRAEGPASRSVFVVAFETGPVVMEAGFVLPDYSYVSAEICWWLSVLFGKRFDDHGLIESIGSYRVPSLDTAPVLCRHTLPQNSRNIRASYPVSLDLREIKRIIPLFSKNDADPAFLQALKTAAKFYCQALRSFEDDPEVSYLHLVTSIEVLSSQIEKSALNKYDADTTKYLELIENHLELGPRIAKHFRSKMMLIKRRFVGVVRALVEEDFFNTGEFERHYGRFKSESFVKRIGAAYDLRSHYVHTGAPFKNWIAYSSAGQNADVQGGTPYGPKKEFAKILGLAPTLVGLERVVRHCLLKAAELNGLYVPNEDVPDDADVAPNPT